MYSYGWKAFDGAAIVINYDLLTGLSVPLVLLIVVVGVSRIRKGLTCKHDLISKAVKRGFAIAEPIGHYVLQVDCP